MMEVMVNTHAGDAGEALQWGPAVGSTRAAPCSHSSAAPRQRPCPAQAHTASGGQRASQEINLVPGVCGRLLLRIHPGLALHIHPRLALCISSFHLSALAESPGAQPWMGQPP